MCKNIRFSTSIDPENIACPEVIDQLQQICQDIIKKKGGESKSEYAKQAKALSLLIEGYQDNRDRINPVHNAIYSMDQLGLSNLSKAAATGVLKRLEYYCHHPLLKDGNILVDLPEIDAPVKTDAQLTYQKVENPDGGDGFKKTSGLLGFYGSQIKPTSGWQSTSRNCWLDSTSNCKPLAVS